MFIRIYAIEGARFSQTFEGFDEAVRNWNGLFFEPDGSFVWVQSETGRRYQLDGMVYDRDGAIEYLELKGNCTIESWRRLCGVLEGNDFRSKLRIQCLESNCWRSPSEVEESISLENSGA